MAEHINRIRKQLDKISFEKINQAKDIENKLEISKELDFQIESILGHKPVSFPIADNKFHYQLIINCYSYALQLWTSAAFLEAANRYTGDDNIISSELVLKFIKEKTLKLQQPKNKCFILYFMNTDLKHGGIYLNENLIESKWDKCSVFQHSLWHVPEKYGNVVEYYSLPTEKEIRKYFLKILKTNGVIIG